MYVRMNRQPVEHMENDISAETIQGGS